MSTDIGALQKQYKTLQQKQHQACVVLSGIGQNNSKSPPNSPDGSVEENDFLNNSMAVMTLSVTMDTKGVHPETTDAVSPMAFGKTKCIFIQNNSKKCHKKHKGHQDKPRLHRQVTEGGNITTEEFCERNETDNEEVDVNEQVDNDDPGTSEIDSTRTTECANIANDDDPKNSTSEGQKLSSNVTSVLSESSEKSKALVKDSYLDKRTENVTDNSKVDQVNLEESRDTGIIADDSMVSETTKQVKDNMDPEKEPVHEVKTENSFHTRREIENYRRDFYKPFYPTKIIRPSTKRHNSVKISNKQSIYQHFTMTKRQLSLDSALEECYHNKATNCAMEFPFPVHSINQHKIQAGMKLGLYDQHALEKLETMKPRKSGRKRLPSLNVE